VTTESKPSRLERYFAGAIGTLVVIALVAVVVFVVIQPSGRVLKSLSDVETARGLITVLFASGTVLLAVLIVSTSLFGSEKDELREKRFEQGKEVLALLLGILGTIVGFYFGQSDGGDGEMQVPELRLSPAVAGAGGTVSLAAPVLGGQPPFSVTLTIAGAPPVTFSESGRLILTEFTVPPTATESLAADVLVVDAAGQELRRTVTVTVTPGDPAAQAPAGSSEPPADIGTDPGDDTGGGTTPPT
jgi:hypothetical protein